MKKIYIIGAAALGLLFYGCSKSSAPDPTPVQVNGVTTYAGNGSAGLVNGTGSGTEFSIPMDMTVDAAGNLYISEQGNNDIRAIAPGGAVVSFVGDGHQGYKDGVASVAEFNNPQGMCIDNTGNIYVADAGNNVIRKITPAGAVSTYAGNGTAGHADGTGATVEFASPTGLAIDKSRNIYVTDFGNNVIRKISSNGTVSTIAGSGTAGLVNGTGTAAQFKQPAGIAIDGSNNLYVAEALNTTIREVTPNGQVTTFATGLPGPSRVCIDGGSNLYVSCGNNTIQKVDNTGKVTAYAGNGTPGFQDGAILSAQFNSPQGLLANTQGVVIVADSQNNRIRIVTP